MSQLETSVETPASFLASQLMICDTSDDAENSVFSSKDLNKKSKAPAESVNFNMLCTPLFKASGSNSFFFHSDNESDHTLLSTGDSEEEFDEIETKLVSKDKSNPFDKNCNAMLPE